MMRFMVLVKATEKSESGVLPTTEQFTEMGAFNQELVKAGMMLAGEGLQPDSKGARIKFSGSRPDGDRRTVHGIQGTHRRLLDDPGEI